MAEKADEQDAKALTDGIWLGEWDDHLDWLEKAARARRKEIDRKAGALLKASVRIGQRVRLKGLSPKYLNGNIAEVVETSGRGRRVAVKLTTDVGRYRAGMSVRCPASCLEIIE